MCTDTTCPNVYDMTSYSDRFNVGDSVTWDTFEGVRNGTVTAVGATWIEVDGRLFDGRAAVLVKRED